MKVGKQKLILEYLLSSSDLYARCAGIIKPSYFDPELRQAIIFLEEYYHKYSAMPKLDKLKAEFDLDFTHVTINRDDISYISDECEKFAKESAVKEAIQASMQDMAKGNYDKVVQNVIESAKISLDRDLGIDLYDNPTFQLQECLISNELIPTQIKGLDKRLDGGCGRTEFTLFSANSGVGKSIMMSNLGDNYAAAGYHVVYISLELSQKKIYTRLASISTGESTETWKQNIHTIANKIEKLKENGAGSYIIKRIKMGSSANDIRSYLKQYEMIYERKPDVIIVDYLDVMTPIGGIGSLSIAEQDKAKSEQLYEIGVDYDAIMFSASQQNRSGITKTSPDQDVIAGGFGKINVVDNYISIYMTPKMRLEGVMVLYYLKTRSSGGAESTPLKFNSHNLQITDIDDEGKVRAIIARLSKEHTPTKPNKKSDETPKTDYSVINGQIEGLPFDSDYIPDDEPESLDDSNGLLDLMTFINNRK